MPLSLNAERVFSEEKAPFFDKKSQTTMNSWFLRVQSFKGIAQKHAGLVHDAFDFIAINHGL